MSKFCPFIGAQLYLVWSITSQLEMAPSGKSQLELHILILSVHCTETCCNRRYFNVHVIRFLLWINHSICKLVPSNLKSMIHLSPWKQLFHRFVISSLDCFCEILKCNKQCLLRYFIPPLPVSPYIGTLPHEQKPYIYMCLLHRFSSTKLPFFMESFKTEQKAVVVSIHSTNTQHL